MTTSRPLLPEAVAADLNVVAEFLSRRDLSDLATSALSTAFGIERADLLILVGSGLPSTAAVAGQAWHGGLSDTLLVTGGVGHSTSYLRQAVRSDPRYNGVDIDGRSEAEILGDILTTVLEVDPTAVLLETRSTNCGANAALSRRKLDEHGLHPSSIVIIQDPLMQRRTHATFERIWQEEPAARFVSFAPFVPHVEARGERLAIAHPDDRQCWDLDRYLSILMGEIPRLRNDEAGYGPRGMDYIDHVDIPPSVEAAYERLLSRYGARARAVP